MHEKIIKAVAQSVTLIHRNVFRRQTRAQPFNTESTLECLDFYVFYIKLKTGGKSWLFKNLKVRLIFLQENSIQQNFIAFSPIQNVKYPTNSFNSIKGLYQPKTFHFQEAIWYVLKALAHIQYRMFQKNREYCKKNMYLEQVDSMKQEKGQPI